jgi:ketosteroid isomerase-like protein
MITALLLAATLTPFDQVVAAERAFAAAAAKDRHKAFLDNLAPDAITYLPGPVPARPSHEGQPPAQGKLVWGPSWVAVASAGDLALSTGPWEIQGLPEDSPLQVKTGWYISVWRRQPGGAWKVAVDAGTSARMQFAVPKEVENGLRVAPGITAPRGTADEAKSAVTTAERALAVAAKSGLGAAIAARADTQVRIYRERRAGAFGTADARTVLANDKRSVSCTTDKIIAAASGDLAYSYGSCASAGSDEQSKLGFLHVWRRQPDGSFKLLIDVTP